MQSSLHLAVNHCMRSFSSSSAFLLNHEFALLTFEPQATIITMVTEEVQANNKLASYVCLSSNPHLLAR